MNIMRKLRGVSSSSTSPSGQQQQQQQQQQSTQQTPSCDEGSQHTALGLMHLKKLFAEYSNPSHPLSDRERDDKLYNMLPLFCKVFGNSPSADMTEKFRDILKFSQNVSKLMVSEIRWRASNQSTETASCAIARFLEIENSEELSNGWMLLSTLNLLAAGDVSIIQVMTSTSVPSTLVKCLYLFFDLPPIENADKAEEGSEFTPRERRVLLQKIFVQLLIRLCSHSQPAEELALKDDLALLFSAITTWCPQYNILWRKSAAEVLMTLSRHGLTQSVVSYIHNKGCVGLCVDNMQRIPEHSPLEIVEMFVTVFCFLKDSSEVAQTLLDDFKSSQGYLFLSEFLLKLEKDESTESQEAIRNLVLIVASLTMCGYVELRPSQASVGSLFHIMGFYLPQPSGRGSSVRNIQAFQVLQTVFLKSASPTLCCTILDAISSIYHADNANYFILENQNTLSQFAEKIHLKTAEIQEKFFQLLEFIVFQLNFVPCKELISLSILIRDEHSLSCSIACMRTLQAVLHHHVLFKDVYREVGLLEVFVTCLQRFSSLLEEKHSSGGRDLTEMENKMGMMTIESLTYLVSASPSNANVFRESGGAKCAHNLVPYIECRHEALAIVRELVLTAGGDDDMATILGLMHSAPPSALELKSDILKALLSCLKESHRTRIVFRKVGGFVYVMSVLVSMEGCLKTDDNNKPQIWNSITLKEILTLLHLVFHTITVAMRFEPANAKFFYHEICLTSLCDTIRLLGCFSNQQTVLDVDESLHAKDESIFYELFTANTTDTEPIIPENISQNLSYACIVIRMLYDIAVDAYDKNTNSFISNLSLKSPIRLKQVCDRKPRIVTPLNLSPQLPDPIIVHSGVVVAILHLLPSIYNASTCEIALSLQIFCAEVIKSLVRTERNQQIMCESGLPGELLQCGKLALEEETHPLHSYFQYMLERLAAQTLEPKDLRNFLRLGEPLSCYSIDEIDSMELATAHHRKPGGPVPLTRVKTLVSMTTPRDFRFRSTAVLPPFVEFDMSSEGFGCLFLPSIAPQYAPISNTSVSTESNVIGGIGTGDRVFPPQTGLTYSTWVCIDKFSDPRVDPHCVRLLTIVRSLLGKDDQIVCLSFILSARDKAIIINTQETSIPPNTADWETDATGESGCRVWCPDLLNEGQWHHLVFVLNRAVLKNSTFSLFVDGQHVHTQRLHYISQIAGGSSANMNIGTSVHCYIGTPPAWRKLSKLTWKQGPCHLFEEVLNQQTIKLINQLGPQYMGSFQAPEIAQRHSLITEERIIFGINSKAVSQLTLARIRKVYTRADSRSIAKQLGMSSHENATPIRVLHNSAGHLYGSARTLGGVVIGYLGVRIFSPRPVARMIENIGGSSVLLGLIAMARDVESLYAAVKALVCVLRSSYATQQEMDRTRGYQTVATLLRRKKSLLNSHILHLAFSLVGTVDSGRESSSIPNITAFNDLLCDLDLWYEAPGDLIKTLLDHMLDLITESSEHKNNLKILRDLQMVPRLLRLLLISCNSLRLLLISSNSSNQQTIFALISALLASNPRSSDLLSFGQTVASTLPQLTDPEKELCLNDNDPTERESIEIILRNRSLQTLHSLLFINKNVNVPFCEELIKVLGFDWILLFLQGHLHSSTVVWGLRILVAICSSQTLLQKFREGTTYGSWIQDSDLLQEGSPAIVLGSPISKFSPNQQSSSKISEIHFLPGFQHLQYLMCQHIAIPEVYFLLIALMMGQPVKLLPADSKLDLNSIWNFIYGVPAGQSVTNLAGKVNICPEAVSVLLSMVRCMLNNENTEGSDSLPSWLKDYPVTIIQFLFFLYHNVCDFLPIFISSDILTALACTLFPKASNELTCSVTSPLDDFKCDTVLVSSPSKDSGLTNHPAKKYIMDLIKVIIVDSLSLPMSGKSAPIIDLVLEATPENSSSNQQSKYQSDVLTILMQHLLAADILIGEQAALPVVAGGSTQHIPPNVYYLSSRIVDKMWQGIFVINPHEIFDFIIKLIAQAKRRPSTTAIVSTDAIYHCLNRTLLFMLSRPTETVIEQKSVVEALHKITNNRSIIFGAGNHQLEFIACLLYCLLQLTVNMKIPIDTSARTTWVINPNQSLEDERLLPSEGHNLMSIAARRVWDELFAWKRLAIEEVFKVSIPTSNNDKTPEIQVIRDMVFDNAHKIWLTYIDAEKKSICRTPWEIQNQIQSKIQKVTGGLTRLASRTKVKREELTRVRHPQACSIAEIESFVLKEIRLVSELIGNQLQQHIQASQHMQQYLLDEWLNTEYELTRERGLWGPNIASNLEKWMLDMTEGPSRMRKKLIRNDLFYIQYQYRPEMEEGDIRALKYKVATSHDSKKYYQRYCPHAMIERDVSFESVTSDNIAYMSNECFTDVENKETEYLQKAILRPGVNRSVSEPDEDNLEFDSETVGDHMTNEENPPDNQALLRLLEEREKINHMFRCARIQGLDTMEGLLLFGKEHLYVIDGFTVSKSRAICDIDSLPENQYDPILPSPGSPRRSRSLRQCSKFSYDDIREVHKRRYLLQPIALEVFSGDGRNYLLAFPRKLRNKVYQRLMTYATAIADNAQQSVAGQKRTANVEAGASLFSSLIGETSVTQRWVRGEISNFQYLMHLNTLAGRSYNDLMQYPVFPWILADYDSEELDLQDSKTFRDLSKPMGAQSFDRLDQFKKRFREWDDPHLETPPYHYGTHYSSAMIVCSYLVRMEPFTQHFLRLQGGHFDLADRMFHSIREAWLSASKHNMADVKELIPEFFYLPEFLLNSNNFDLGAKQNGVYLGDVLLPPWAKGDTLEFIRVHRQALECDYVSAHLHEWIDLIFGYKQQGPAAVDAINVFHHLFYEGNVDIYNIDDPLKKNATIGFINNFGQIPKQLFKKPHPAKKTGNRTSLFDNAQSFNMNYSANLFFHNLDNLRPSIQPIKELKAPVGQILQYEKSVLAVEQNKALMPAGYNKYVAWGFADHSLRIGYYDSDKAALVCETNLNGEVVACVCPNAKIVITAGTSSVVTVWEYHRKILKVKESLYGHTDAVTCLAASPAFNVIVSGSRDTTAILWDLSRFKYVRQLRGHAAPVAAVAVNELTGDIATCAGTWLHLWTINGVELANVNTCVGRADRMQQILCVAFSQINEWDSQNVVMTGSTDGVTRMWSLDFVQVPNDTPKSEINELKETLKEEEDKKEKKDGENSTRKRVTELVKQMSLSGEYSSDNGVLLAKSGSESSLTEEEEEDDGEEKTESSGNIVIIRRRPSTQHNTEFRKSEGSRLEGLVCHNRTESESDTKTSLSCATDALRTSKSDTSLTDSFVVLGECGEETPKRKNLLNTLRPGFKWQRQLVFRSKLTMHTAYDRKDNSEPASVTCLAVSKDHRTMYVGDARGRVFSWSVAGQPGRCAADHWLKDEGADNCIGCNVRFSLYERRHHCRNCGQVFCSRCSRFESEISRLRIMKPVRVCQTCHNTLKASTTDS